jgi:transposase
VRDADGRENLDPVLRATWGDRLGLVVEAIDFVRYALAVLASPRYRARFDDALHLSYPRIPEPRDAKLFRSAVLAGEALVRAFTTMPRESDGDVEVAIGHHRVRSGALARAITHADEVTESILGALD